LAKHTSKIKSERKPLIETYSSQSKSKSKSIKESNEEQVAESVSQAFDEMGATMYLNQVTKEIRDRKKQSESSRF
jgi:benzoyl-CoA reductase/2-hydroxyglutaryl-CoA dehydratase subunit BcrC/BadD/HgdB